ncbi:MAG: AAA family ATPase [Candidatus Eisenbacteria bacterium]|uniref:AAA family ATPase n=1 Tax=Eiseniibacteriota bacterium TaxID=2212470 RepID=A0A948RUL4_UNCEI|nr:AAA family ATPase [Candidatus Eisenbacteria bacterium]
MYSNMELAHLTGIPLGRVSGLCNLLVNKGILIFDEASVQYSLSPDPKTRQILEILREQLQDPAQSIEIRSKIEDILALGKPLALSRLIHEDTFRDIGVPGLNKILGRDDPQMIFNKDFSLIAEDGLPRGHCYLVKGAPGTGKTTLGIQIALRHANRRARFLTFEEDVTQLLHDMKPYIASNEDVKSEKVPIGWNRHDLKNIIRPLRKIRAPLVWKDPEAVIDELTALLDRELPKLIIVDSISRFRDLADKERARHVLRRFIRILKARRITAIFLGEDRGEENAFEDYEVDGILELEWIGDIIYLTVAKLRGQRSFRGPHSAKLISAEEIKMQPPFLISRGNHNNHGPHLTVGFNVFPDISVYTEQLNNEEEKEVPLKTIDTDCNGNQKRNILEMVVISSGTEGLDKLLPVRVPKGGPDSSRDKKSNTRQAKATLNHPENNSPDIGKSFGFKRGEIVLLVGSAGSGKTLLGLNFLISRPDTKNIVNKINEGKGDINHKSIWLNLEGNIDTLRFAVAGFEGQIGETLNNALHGATNSGSLGPCIIRHYTPLNLDLNRLIYELEILTNQDDYKIDRLVIDSVTELERSSAKGQPDIKTFLSGLIAYLRVKNITTVFISRSDTFFRSIDKIEEQVSSLVDLILCIRNFDIHNEIHRGIYVQKARGRVHTSKIMRMTIDARSGISIDDSGWDHENLLAGDTRSIQRPEIFFKLFYENKAEENVNSAIIKDFRYNRYPGGEPKFTLVRKPSIYTEFWSFRGQYSAGHANTRVLSIADYVLSAFRDADRLDGLKNYVKGDLIYRIKGQDHLRRLYLPPTGQEAPQKVSTSNTHNPDESLLIDAIPCYRDCGFMAYKNPTFSDNNHNCSTNIRDSIQELITLQSNMDEVCTEIHAQKKASWYNTSYSPATLKYYTWPKLLKWIKSFNRCLKEIEGEHDESDKTIAFAFPPLDHHSEFVAFFMELLWSFGGDIFEIQINNVFHKTNFREKFRNKIRDTIIIDLIDYYANKCEAAFKRPDCNANGSDNNRWKSQLLETFTKILQNEGDDSKCNNMDVLNDLKSKFKEYGFLDRGIEFKDVCHWIATFVESIRDKEEEDGVLDWEKLANARVLKLNDPPFVESLTLILQLIVDAGVKNPCGGDFRDRAVLARYWYSLLPKRGVRRGLRQRDKNYHILPLPLAPIDMSPTVKEIGTIYRSVTCVTYWFLAMLKGALSPEIGGNFIESMSSPDYYNHRLRENTGIPILDWELEKEEYVRLDPEAYNVTRGIIDTGMRYEATLENISKHIFMLMNKRDAQSSPENSPVENPMQNSEQSDNDESKSYMHKVLDNDPACLPRELREAFSNKSEKKHKKSTTNILNSRKYFAKARQTRIAFYQIEQALHHELRQFLDTSNLESIKAKNENAIEKESPHKSKLEEKKRAFEGCISNQKKDNSEGRDSGEVARHWILDGIVKETSDNFRLHIIFELIIYFYRWDRDKSITSPYIGGD